MPALANAMAMPLPMVPNPTTAADRTGSVGVSGARPSTLATARSASSTCRWTAASVIPRPPRGILRPAHPREHGGKELTEEGAHDGHGEAPGQELAEEHARGRGVVHRRDAQRADRGEGRDVHECAPHVDAQ